MSKLAEFIKALEVETSLAILAGCAVVFTACIIITTANSIVDSYQAKKELREAYKAVFTLPARVEKLEQATNKPSVVRKRGR